ncbi:MAG: PTS sugar transporter subunit IIA [Anaerolineaceae bacterium]|nr:PTS sugar transporter subunit IIA [Anaerolineaceae bacterium]
MELVINSKNMCAGLSAKHKEEVIKILSDKFFSSGLVTKDFYDHVIKREEVFPTGLPTVIPVALCHTDPEFVIKNALGVATLKEAVKFQEMGSPENTLDVQIVFLLALKESKDQIFWLMNIVEVFKDKNALEQILYASSEEGLEQNIKKLFKI